MKKTKKERLDKRSRPIITLVLFLLFGTGYAQQLAFPTAEGFGKHTIGGRGGQLYIVSNLNDAGEGSLREGVEASGKRTIVFNVSGIIELESQLKISNNDLSILGQSAPGDGICIANYTVQISASNVIIRYIRFRPGSIQDTEFDASWGRYNSDIVFDHCSFSWGSDEQASFYNNTNFTMQHCIISESLYSSSHPKVDHGYGGIWGGMGATFHHNLIANHTSRTPRFCGARFHLETASTEIVDFRNNVIFNWGFNSAYGGEAGNHNMINNYYKPGPATRSGNISYRIVNPSDTKSDGNPISTWYVDGNHVVGNATVSSDNWNGGVQIQDDNISINELKLNSAISAAGINTETALEAYETVLNHAGASLKRDAADLRVVTSTRTGVANYGGVFGDNTGIIDHENQVGGFPTYNTYDVITDIDKDGIDDTWEELHGLIVGTKDDAGDVDGDGYSNIEEYLNCLLGEGDGCTVVTDCNGDVEGTAALDECGVCTGGNTGLTACSGAIQGEDFCEAIGVLEASNLGFVGAGYVNFDNAIGSSGTWYLNSEEAGEKTIGVRYANGGTAARSMSVSVNGGVQATFTGAQSGDWSTWQIEELSLTLTEGVNQLIFTATGTDGGPNVDVIGFVSDGLLAGGCTADCNGVIGGAAYLDDCANCVSGNTNLEACTQDCNGEWGGTAQTDACGVCLVDNTILPCSGSLEAETACMLDGTIDNNNEGYSGDGFVNTNNELDASVSWLLNSTTAQSATITFVYANGGATARNGSITINGANVGTLDLSPTGSWTTWNMVSVNVDLQQGSNEIIIAATTADGLANIDQLHFSEGVSNANCLITQIDENITVKLEVAPNPTQSKIHWNIEQNWVLLSSLGEALLNGTGKEADLSSLPKGLYILKLNGIGYEVIKE